MKKKTEQLYLILLPALFMFPLFKESISSFIIILLALNTLLYRISTKKIELELKELLILSFPFWLILLFSLIRYSDFASLFAIKKALFFLIIPLVFLSIPIEFFTKKKLHFYFEVLKISCFVIAIGYVVAFLTVYNYSDFFVLKYEIPKFRIFVYSEVPFFRIHPTYYTSIVLFCTAYSFEKVLRQKKYLELIYVAVFVIITFMLLAKINIVMMIGLLLYMMVFRSKISFKQKIASSFFFLTATIVLIVSIPGIKYRFLEIFKSYDKPPVGLSYDSTNIRVSIYHCCWSIAKENYLFGVGFENLQSELTHCYSSNYDSSFYVKHNYLTHNYYYYFLLSSGIFGLLLYLFYLANIIRICFQSNIFIFKVLLLNIIVICFFEDFLYRHYGVLFFNLILVCFIRYQKNVQLKGSGEVF